eukprot:Phypoly_transcript_08983.p1 GENE.Phypoly_transcript_08983~~Phypoly_transcript_08983.p1  ORF type:complete len:425 (+),score=71.99 Phypoly_transcript_08983:32-1276(+)
MECRLGNASTSSRVMCGARSCVLVCAMTHNTQLKRKFDDIANLTQSLKDTFAEVLECKKREEKRSFPALLNKGSSLLLDLKRLADFTQEEEEELARLSTNKSKLEPLDAQLQILQYEKDSYLSEIEQCRQYGSDDISRLLSTENENETNEMQLERKRHISAASEDFHHQTMAALNSKLLEKQRLKKELEGLQEKKQQLKESVAADTKKLVNLDAKLKTVSKNASLFQQYIQTIPYKQTKISNDLQHLPAPLFLIYQQAASYSEFFDNDVEVLLNGDISDAGSQPTTLLTPHPLSVTIRFPARLYFAVKFVYYPNLQIVTASTDNTGILNNLFPNDNGRAFPSASWEYLAAETGQKLTVEQLEGLPYKWAQAISHLEHLSASLLSTPNTTVDSPDGDVAATFHNVIKRIKSSIGS